MQPQGLDHETLGVIFKVETSNLPAYTGAINPEDGFNLIRINKVIEPESIEKNKLDNFGKQLQQMITQEEMSSYLTMLRKRYEVRVKQDNF
jgi:peptidyl-prolyl cis-trans isomerase D